MSYFRIQKARINSFKVPKEYDRKWLNIGIPVQNDEHLRLGLKEVGDAVLPSAEFGPTCSKNANGYFFTDETQEKEYRYVSTTWMHPYGNEEAQIVPVDHYRYCYPKSEVPPIGIELVLTTDPQGNRYIVADLTEEVREKYLKEAVNLFLEIFGECYVYRGEVETFDMKIRRRCHWKILPPGERPSEHLIAQLEAQRKDPDTFDVNRLGYVEQYDAETIVEGINGFNGYYAYVFKKYCVLESAVYGNATYIIPRENWEELSQRTKRDLLDNDLVLQKIIHRTNWYELFAKAMHDLEGL